jgi:gamma-glutamylcyclotransferase (GGCT)/AIG2-like uncharacterized protein YtfP
MKKVKYFAYGNNIDVDIIKKRLGNVKFCRNAILKGYKLSFDKDGGLCTYANITYTGQEKDFVLGRVYELNMFQLKLLDMIEGYPQHYIRKEVTIDNEVCFIYYSNIKFIIEDKLPEKSYLDRIVKSNKEISDILGINNKVNLDYFNSINKLIVSDLRKIFVYGTLKKGFSNEHVMKAINAQYLGKVNTLEKYPMFILNDPFPYLQNNPGKGFNIEGELYQVSNHMINSVLDPFEGSPSLYYRSSLKVLDKEGKITENVGVYFKSEDISLNKIELISCYD